MEFKEFREKMEKAKTMNDGNKLIAQLSDLQLLEVVVTMEKMQEISGITMRDEWVLSTARIFRKHPEFKKTYLPKSKKIKVV